MARSLDPQKRAHILQTALRLFVTNGVANTSTAQISAEAGIAAGTLFLYFPTKQELIDTLILDIAEAQSRLIESRLQPDLTARESFFAIWSSSIEWFIDNPPAYEYVQQVRDTGLVSPAAVQKSGSVFAFYYTAIQKGLREGCLKPAPVELIGDYLYQDIVAVMNYLRRQPALTDRADLIRQGFDMFWDGVRA